ncbi:DUF934 domain-containing protein [Planktotalea sp.]|uniref:DUF934 domain-containing protein n=1 Tax=Planktotalea sp. TaxID=2029877 RepID=UPI0025D2B95F|nr:DUF934 domain-containing protein [Planktotalea sp.]
MTVLVTDKGFTLDDWVAKYGGTIALDLASGVDPTTLNIPDTVQMIRVDFPSFADGRGFTIARQLRLRGYTGRLRARGHVIADQYAMARRAGFDEVEIDNSLAQRQPEPDWIARSDWQTGDYQARLRG